MIFAGAWDVYAERTIIENHLQYLNRLIPGAWQLAIVASMDVTGFQCEYSHSF